MDKWIDVRYRLPEIDGKTVLCYVKNSSTGGETYVTGCIQQRKHWFLQTCNIGVATFPNHYWKVTHWMPLPEPPTPSLNFCPKCGFVAVYDEYQQDGVRVRCTHCGHKTEFYNDKIKASEDWNSQ